MYVVFSVFPLIWRLDLKEPLELFFKQRKKNWNKL